jgi:hypothetical protein
MSVEWRRFSQRSCGRRRSAMSEEMVEVVNIFKVLHDRRFNENGLNGIA